MDDRKSNYIQFTRNFMDNQIVQKYFSERNLSKKIITEKLVGFCPIYSRYSFPLLRGRLIVPICNVDGNIIALAGRQIPSLKDDVYKSFWESYGEEPAKCQDRINKWNKGKWINEPYQKTRNLFFLNHSKKSIIDKNYIVLVEGYFDAYGLFDNGVENVAALCGTSISDYQVALAMRYCDNIVLLMDSDDPGRMAAKNISVKIESLGGRALKLFLPYGSDPDEFAQNYDLSFLDETVNSMLSNGKKDLYIRV